MNSRTVFSLQVYQRADLNKMLMSMSVGPYCDLAQDVASTNWTQGAVVSLVLDENERECKISVLTVPAHFTIAVCNFRNANHADPRPTT